MDSFSSLKSSQCRANLCGTPLRTIALAQGCIPNLSTHHPPSTSLSCYCWLTLLVSHTHFYSVSHFPSWFPTFPPSACLCWPSPGHLLSLSPCHPETQLFWLGIPMPCVFPLHSTDLDSKYKLQLIQLPWGYETISLANAWRCSMKSMGNNRNKVTNEENYGVLVESLSGYLQVLKQH